MNKYPVEILYMGFFLPGLFAATFFVEGIYKIYNHENGIFTLVLGLIFLIGLGAFYTIVIPK